MAKSSNEMDIEKLNSLKEIAGMLRNIRESISSSIADAAILLDVSEQYLEELESNSFEIWKYSPRMLKHFITIYEIIEHTAQVYCLQNPTGKLKHQ